MRRTTLITGASSGLGEGMARAFAAKGCDLALCARRTERLEALQAELKSQYPQLRVEIAALDVCDHDQVFSVFRQFDQALGGLDRIVVNAGIGVGAPIGSGQFELNRQTAETNFVAALAQCEAAMELFRSRNAGHLVVLSSVSAVRGFGGAFNTYAATKAGVAALAEGIRLDTLNTPIRVTTLFPGYILTAINEKTKNAPFRVDLDTGTRALVRAIESEKNTAFVPSWPWTLLAPILRRLPLRLLKKMN